MKTKAKNTSAQTPAYTLEQIHNVLANTGVKLIENESIAEQLRAEIEGVIAFLKEKKIRLTQRVSRTNPERGCPILSFVALRGDEYYRSIRIEKSMQAGMTKQEAEKEASTPGAVKSIQQLSNNLVCRIRASVSAGRWLSKQEYQKLAAKKSANKTGKVEKSGKPGKTGNASKAKTENSDKPMSEKIRIAINTVIQMIQKDEQPTGYDPVELINSLKEALDCID